MTDPLDQLREAGTPTSMPDVGAIRARSRRIEYRRRLALSGGAVAVALFAVVGVLIQSDPAERPTTLAQRGPDAPPSAQLESAPQLATTGEDATKGSTGVSSAEGSVVTSTDAPAEADNGRSSDAAAMPAAGGEKMQGLDATLTVKKRTAGRGAVFTLKVCNPSTNETSRTFGSSQRADFEVTRGGEEALWRWSDGMAFTQVVGEEQWKAKECKSWTVEWDGLTSAGTPASPGTYEARAILKSQPEQVAEPKTFCLEVC